jgi:hypothetical protein
MLGRLSSPERSVGITTSAITVRRSSITSQPMAMCPLGVCSERASDSTRTRTTVLATDSVRPNMTAGVHAQPKA